MPPVLIVTAVAVALVALFVGLIVAGAPRASLRERWRYAIATLAWESGAATLLGVTAADVEAARKRVDELRDQHGTAIQAAHDKLKQLRDENGGGALPPEKAGEVAKIFANADSLGLEIDEASKNYHELQQRAFGRDPEDRMSVEDAQRRGHTPATIRGASLASRLVASEQWERARQAAKRGGGSGGGSAAAIMRELEGAELANSGETAAVLSPHGALRGGVPEAQTNDFSPLVPDDRSRLSNPQLIPTRPPSLLDLITISTTELDVIDYIVQTAQTINVDATPGGPTVPPTAIPLAEYVALPESDLAVERRQMPIVDRGTVLTVPERNLEDEGRVRSFIDGRLTRGLQLDAEIQLLNGDGGADDLLGLLNWPGVGTLEATAGEPVAVAIYRGITQVRMNSFREPTAIAYRPDTLSSIVTARDVDGRYVNTAGPLSPFGQTIWGFQAVVAHVLSTLAGDARAIVGVWDELELVLRSGVAIREFNQHADYARRRLVLLRALYRAAALVNDPRAFSVVDLVPPVGP